MATAFPHFHASTSAAWGCHFHVFTALNMGATVPPHRATTTLVPNNGFLHRSHTPSRHLFSHHPFTLPKLGSRYLGSTICSLIAFKDGRATHFSNRTLVITSVHHNPSTHSLAMYSGSSADNKRSKIGKDGHETHSSDRMPSVASARTTTLWVVFLHGKSIDCAWVTVAVKVTAMTVPLYVFFASFTYYTCSSLLHSNNPVAGQACSICAIRTLRH